MSDDACEMQDELDARVPELKALLNKPTYNELEAKLRAARELPGKWRINAGYFSINECADELEALLKAEVLDK